MTVEGRDALNIYIPMRISGLTPEQILDAVEEIRASRTRLLAEIAQRAEKKPRAPGGGRKRKSSAIDLSKLDVVAAMEAMAANLGVSVEELKRLAAKPSGDREANGDIVSSG